jgi:hypothetical protein
MRQARTLSRRWGMEVGSGSQSTQWLETSSLVGDAEYVSGLAAASDDRGCAARVERASVTKATAMRRGPSCSRKIRPRREDVAYAILCNRSLGVLVVLLDIWTTSAANTAVEG